MLTKIDKKSIFAGGRRYTAKTGIVCMLLTLFFAVIAVYFFGCSPIGDGYLLHQAGWGKLVYLLLCLLPASAAATALCVRYRETIEALDREWLRKRKADITVKFHMKKRELWLLGVIVVIGGILRLTGYNWGVTSIFQPDESNLVRPVLIMAMDKWPYYNYFGYPNMFVSRLAWLCILIYSKITGVTIGITMIEGYFIFRIIVGLLSTATIVTAFLIGNYIKERLGLILAALVAVFPEYVCLAKQVTGDSTALFFMTLLLLASFVYEERRTYSSVFWMSAFAAMATAEKWHAAVGCFYIAAVVIWNSRRIGDVIRQGFCAFLSYIAVLSLIAPSLFWNLYDAVGGILYMYEYDKEGKVYTWGELFIGHNSDFLEYIGVAAVVFFGIGAAALWKTRNKRYCIVLLGVFKIAAICCMNRGFPRWALEYYFILLFVIALGMHGVLYCGKRGAAFAGCAGAALVLGSLLAGSVLNAVTAEASIRDTRLLQDAYCDAHGITKENSMYEYYTGFRPGGINPGKEDGLSDEYQKLTDMLRVDGNGMLYKTDERIEYAIDLIGNYDTDTTALLAQQCPVVESFYAAGPDICVRPVTGVKKSWNEFGIFWNNYMQIKQIINGANTGADIVIYDVRALPEK